MYESNRPERTDREEDEREEYLKLTDQHRAHLDYALSLFFLERMFAKVLKSFVEINGFRVLPNDGV